MTSSATNSSLSYAYTKGIGYIFLITFLSYYVQYPSLSSIGGIEPSEVVFQRTFPSLYYPVAKGYIDTDSLVELINLIGVATSMVIASGIVQHALLYLLITAIYYFLVLLGGQFYTFQWDILLIEVGFLTALCIAPWQSLNLKEEETVSFVGCWPLRFLLFKLMFMSGIVKIQAECPTWQNLTALEYHFATQCLPGPLAWYAHQLPPFILRLGVAATFVIEIPATIFLIVPSLQIRRIGAWMQIVLQVLIIGTGNYNFFNLLTIALCFPCMIGEDNIMKGRSRGTTSWIQHHLGTIQTAMCVIFLSISCKEMFQLEQYITEEGKHMRWLKLSMNRHDCNNLVEKTLPVVILFTLLCTFVSGLHTVRKNVTNNTGVSSLAHTLVCLTCIVVTAMPLFDLAPGMHQSWFMKQSTLRNIRRQSSVVSHGYGLFRRMTGVGKATFSGTNALGLPSSIVARPEIILEAIIIDNENVSGNSTSENDWQELNFRWKPGAIDRRPRQVAPHQPRFEWRMWFAALGSVQHNAWLVSFVDKILAGCPSVINLLDEHDLIAKKKRIQMVRAELYQYDFTRLDTEWARSIPGVHILGADDGEAWWKRKAVGQYLPALDSNNESLKAFLQHAGYSACRAEDERCYAVGPSCQVAYFLRRILSVNPLLFCIIAISLCAIVDATRSSRVITRRPKMKRD